MLCTWCFGWYTWCFGWCFSWCIVWHSLCFVWCTWFLVGVLWDGLSGIFINKICGFVFTLSEYTLLNAALSRGKSTPPQVLMSMVAMVLMLLSMLRSMAMVVMIKAGRTQLGATTVLAVVTIGFGGKAKPQVKLYPFLSYICVHSIHIYNLLLNFKNLFDVD